FFSMSQTSFLVPGDIALGPATVRIVSLSRILISAAVSIRRVSPGLLSANSNGRGPAAAQIIRVHPDGSQEPAEPTAAYNPSTREWIPVAIEPASGGDDLLLVLYGTGVRRHSAPVLVTINGLSVSASYAGPDTANPGIDQIRVLLPRSLQQGTTDVLITVEGTSSNSVTLSFR